MEKILVEQLSQLAQQFINSLLTESRNKNLLTNRQKCSCSRQTSLRQQRYNDLTGLLDSAVQQPYRTTAFKNSASFSMIKVPIAANARRLSGYSRNWGHASSMTQKSVMQKILHHSNNLPPEDQAILLAIARLESGFNPDAANPKSSASGVFQIIKSTGENLGLPQHKSFDADLNIKAGILLYEENLEILNKKFPHLEGNERAKMMFALHHDGPSLKHGGYAMAEKQIVPFLDSYRKIAENAL